MEDGDELRAALQRRHQVPALQGARLIRKGQFQGRREFVFSFHGGEELFGDLLGAAAARGRAFELRDGVHEPLAIRIAEGVEPAAEGNILRKKGFELGGNDGDALGRVRLEKKIGASSGSDAGAGLHLFIDEQEMNAPARGKQGSAKGESIDFALNAEVAADAPGFVDAERNPNDGPAEIAGHAFERSLEGFRREFAFRFAFSPSIFHGRTARAASLDFTGAPEPSRSA